MDEVKLIVRVKKKLVVLDLFEMDMKTFLDWLHAAVVLLSLFFGIYRTVFRDEHVCKVE